MITRLRLQRVTEQVRCRNSSSARIEPGVPIARPATQPRSSEPKRVLGKLRVIE